MMSKFYNKLPKLSGINNDIQCTSLTHDLHSLVYITIALHNCTHDNRVLVCICHIHIKLMHPYNFVPLSLLSKLVRVIFNERQLLCYIYNAIYGMVIVTKYEDLLYRVLDAITTQPYIHVPADCRVQSAYTLY